MFCETELFNKSKASTSYFDRIHFPVSNLYFLMNYQKKGKSQKCLNAIKYGRNESLAKYLGNTIQIDETYDLIVPIPLHPKKEQIRGFNQSEAFGLGISSGKVNTEILKRIKHTNAFAKKNRKDRWKEVEELYDYKKKESLEGKKVLLVDDILTTGATLTTCVELLNNLNPKKIDIAVIAVTEQN